MFFPLSLAVALALDIIIALTHTFFIIRSPSSSRCSFRSHSRFSFREFYLSRFHSYSLALTSHSHPLPLALTNAFPLPLVLALALAFAHALAFTLASI